MPYASTQHFLVSPRTPYAKRLRQQFRTPRASMASDDLSPDLADYDRDGQPATRQQIAGLASGGFLLEAQSVVLLGPPGAGRAHLATALGIVAARHGHRLLCATATDWATRRINDQRQGNLPRELARLCRYGS